MTTGSTKFGARPPLACEIAADRVLAGRSADAGRMVEMCSAQELAPGTVIPDLMESNLRDGTAIRSAIESALGGISGRSRDVIAILPDTAVRVVLLDFETLPSKPEEAEAVVRFRLKKSLPFNLDEARVSYHAQTGGTGLRAVAAVVLNSVLQEYESAFRDAGYNPGVVMPSMLAALGAADADKPTLVVKVDARSIGIAILDQEQYFSSVRWRMSAASRSVVNNWRRKYIRRSCFSRTRTNSILTGFISLACRKQSAPRPHSRPRLARRWQNWSPLPRSEPLPARFRAGGWQAW